MAIARRGDQHATVPDPAAFRLAVRLDCVDRRVRCATKAQAVSTSQLSDGRGRDAETVSDQSVGAEVQPLVANSASEPFAASSAKTVSWRSLTPWPVGLYITGVAWMLLRLALSTWQAQRLRTRASFIDSGPRHEFLQSLARRWRLQVVPQLALAEQVVIPKVVGLVRPTILLPAAALTGLSRQELEMILTHELAHVRRYDVWIHLTQRLAEAVLFFNPALWFLSRRISLYREYCCDEMACQLSDDDHAADATTEPNRLKSLPTKRWP